MTVRSRLTNMQKNRIALKYIQFRENQDSDEGPDVTGGYDKAIQRYGDAKQQKAVEQRAVGQIMNSMNDYVKNASKLME